MIRHIISLCQAEFSQLIKALFSNRSSMCPGIKYILL